MGGRHQLPRTRRQFARQLAASTLLIGSVGFVGYLGLSDMDVLYVVPPEPVPDYIAAPTTPPPPPPTTSKPPPAPATTSSTPRPTPTPSRTPVTPKPTPPPAPKPAVKACPSTGFGGVKPWVARAGHHLAGRFGINLLTIGGVRLNAIDRNGHPSGRALDLPVTRSQGDALAAYALANRAALGVEYVIWRQRYNDGSGWDPMEDRGSPTANHQNHVHANFRATPGNGGFTC